MSLNQLLSASLRTLLAALALLICSNATAAGLSLATVRSDANPDAWASEGSVEALRRVEIAPKCPAALSPWPSKLGTWPRPCMWSDRCAALSIPIKVRLRSYSN